MGRYAASCVPAVQLLCLAAFCIVSFVLQLRYYMHSDLATKRHYRLQRLQIHAAPGCETRECAVHYVGATCMAVVGRCACAWRQLAVVLPVPSVESMLQSDAEGMPMPKATLL